MKIILTAGVAAVLVTVTACGGEGTNQTNQSTTATSRERVASTTPETHSASGMVEKVAAGQVTIAHGPVQSLQWPAMTMAFSAQDAALLEGIRAGDRVAFSFTQSDGRYTLTAISKK